jgi:hypothetical protein
MSLYVIAAALFAALAESTIAIAASKAYFMTSSEQVLTLQRFYDFRISLETAPRDRSSETRSRRRLRSLRHARGRNRRSGKPQVTVAL